jgi:aquaporin Z
MASGLLAEVILTFIFLIAIFGATSNAAPGGFAGIAIGLSLALIYSAGISVTGVSADPARGRGPAVFAGITEISQL